jgi:hypothetical protein
VREWHSKAGAAGVREQGKGTRGLPRNLGDPYCSTRGSGLGVTKVRGRNILACPDLSTLELDRRYE